MFYINTEEQAKYMQIEKECWWWLGSAWWLSNQNSTVRGRLAKKKSNKGWVNWEIIQIFPTKKYWHCPRSRAWKRQTRLTFHGPVLLHFPIIYFTFSKHWTQITSSFSKMNIFTDYMNSFNIYFRSVNTIERYCKDLLPCVNRFEELKWHSQIHLLSASPKVSLYL